MEHSTQKDENVINIPIAKTTIRVESIPEESPNRVSETETSYDQYLRTGEPYIQTPSKQNLSMGSGSEAPVFYRNRTVEDTITSNHKKQIQEGHEKPNDFSYRNSYDSLHSVQQRSKQSRISSQSYHNAQLTNPVRYSSGYSRNSVVIDMNISLNVDGQGIKVSTNTQNIPLNPESVPMPMPVHNIQRIYVDLELPPHNSHVPSSRSVVQYDNDRN